jgi:hypothetical protein
MRNVELLTNEEKVIHSQALDLNALSAYIVSIVVREKTA